MTDKTDDEALCAYIDGELSAEETARLTERLTKEPALLKRLETMRSADGDVRKVYASLDRQPMPKGVLDLLDETDATSSEAAMADTGDNVVAMPPRAPRSWFDVPMAMAASVALLAGILLGGLLGDETAGPGSPITIAEVIAPETDLHRLLEGTVSAEPVAFSDGARGNVILTFEAPSGEYCRQFHVEESSRSVDGLACRRGDGWRVDTLSFGPATPGGFQTASGGAPAAVRAAVDARIGAAEPLDPAEESLIISESWSKTEN